MTLPLLAPPPDPLMGYAPAPPRRPRLPQTAVQHLAPLPSPLPLTLADPASLDYWREIPMPFWRTSAPEFWARMTPLTIPQYVAFRLSRHPDHVSLAATSSIFRSWQERGANWDQLMMVAHPRLWARTHRSTLFRLDPRRMPGVGPVGRARPVGPANPLRALAEWATPEHELESRYLIAGLRWPIGWRDRATHVQRLLRRGRAAGYVVDVREASVPVHVYRPSARWCRANGIPVPRWKTSALEHGQLAVEAYLALLGAAGDIGSWRVVRSEAELLSVTRAGQGAIARGAHLGGVPDLVVEHVAGRRVAVEILTDSYRDEDLAEKYGQLSSAVHFVATSRTLAARAARAMTRTHHWYF